MDKDLNQVNKWDPYDFWSEIEASDWKCPEDEDPCKPIEPKERPNSKNIMKE